MRTGYLYAALAFFTWGLFPLYLQFIAAVPPLEVVLHRSTWALLFVLGVLAWQRNWAWLPATLRRPRHVAAFAGSALLLSVNWLIYVYAVQTGRVVEAALGYFINPLVSVLLGVVVLRERLRPLQQLAVALAAGGVAWLAWDAGKLPWISLALAGSFGLYGLMRKTAPLGALEGLTLETLLLAPIVLPALAWWTLHQGGVLLHGATPQLGWLLLSGPITALPLLCFAGAARRLPLATLGMMQYTAPTIQLALGVWVFNEPFGAARFAGFVPIWAALALVSAEVWKRSVSDGSGDRKPTAPPSRPRPPR